LRLYDQPAHIKPIPIPAKLNGFAGRDTAHPSVPNGKAKIDRLKRLQVKKLPIEGGHEVSSIQDGIALHLSRYVRKNTSISLAG